MPAPYADQFNVNQTPQTEPIPGREKDMTPNSAGGYSFALDDWKRLDRFLVLGVEGNTYYATAKQLTKENAKVVIDLIKKDGQRVVARIQEISQAGRAYKNDPALFVLALALSFGDQDTKKAAELALPKIARIGTHLFTFVEYVDKMRGWGRGLKRAIGDWYQHQGNDALIHQITKYQQRNGWSHRDLLSLAHPKPTDEIRSDLYRYIAFDLMPKDEQVYLSAIKSLPGMNPGKVAELIREYKLPREVIPTELLTESLVWEALLEDMPMTAMIRNLATMTRVGLLAPMSVAVDTVCGRLRDRERLKKARVHPIQILAALTTYQSGHGARGTNTWTPVARIVDALDGAFYMTFETIEPTNKRYVLALDVSGSMGGGTICDVPGLTPRHGAAAMALVTAATEPNHVFVAFTNGTYPSQHPSIGFNSGISTLDISPRQRLDDVMKITSNLPFGGTDCALPMLWALENKIQADAFVVLTDSETWAGEVHPTQALQQYRRKMNIPAKLIVVGMVANSFSIADPNDDGMLDIVGFSTDTPTIISDFAKN